MKWVLAIALAPVAILASASELVPGTLSAVATQHSIGVEWQVSGDTNHTATGSIEYRVKGTTDWHAGLELLRVDFNGTNTIAGSVLFLSPGTVYDLAVAISDPDGGSAQQQLEVSTRPVPSKSVNGDVWHVSAGAQNGNGSAAQPFGSIASGQDAAAPGDTVMIHAGVYSDVVFSKAGDESAYLVFEAAGDGEATILGARVDADRVWIEGLTFRDRTNALRTAGSPADVVISRNTFLNNHYSVYLSGGGEGWTIADNVIVGDNVYEDGSFSGEGIELNFTSGHVVAHNRISGSGDGISYPLANVDIFGNDIFDMSDDGIEGDNGRANVRMWRNRLQNSLHNGISFQNQNGAPWYLIRNVIINYDEAALKYRTTDRYVLLGNTFINWDRVIDNWGQNILNAYSRNNLFVSVNGGPLFQMIYPGFNYPTVLINWRTSLDYDGFDWGGYATPFEYQSAIFSNLAELQSATGLWLNGVAVDARQCLPELGLVAGPTPMRVPPMHARLQAPCAAIDAGVSVPNLSENFVGSAPDLGAYELGALLPIYGPRAQVPDTDGDTIVDALDNCTLVANAAQRDSDNDGYGNLCDTDLNQDCVTNVVDLGLLRSEFFTDDDDADFDGDGVVNVVDLGILRLNFFAAPGPSGIASLCAP